MDKQNEKKIAIICYTIAGNELAEKIKKIEEESGYEVEIGFKPKNTALWLKERFNESELLIFICAMGIAVRHIAPFIKSKLTDPAVIVMDEKAKNVISVLSGHIGGANDFTVSLADKLGANPVITTASDVGGKIAVDVFAVKNDLVITDYEMAKKIAAEIVANKRVGFYCEGNVLGDLPEEFVLVKDVSECSGKLDYCICISDKRYECMQIPDDVKVLRLIPKSIVLGIGCKRGKSMREIDDVVKGEMERLDLTMESVGALASLDLKKDEEGLNLFIKRYGLKASYYSAVELDKVEGEFEKSDFVEKITGVDNVCERALIKYLSESDENAYNDERLLLKKKKYSGITLAVARIDWSVNFE